MTNWKRYIKDSIPSPAKNTLYLNKEVAELDKPGNKLYAWTDADDFEKNRYKEGRTKNLAWERIKGYESKKRKIIVDIIVDKAFNNAGTDQKFNEFRSENNSYPATLVDEDEVTSKEVMQYNSFDDVQEIISLRRKFLQKWLDDDSAGRIEELDIRFTTADSLIKYNEYKQHNDGPKTYGWEKDTRTGKELLQAVMGKLSGKSNLFFGSDFYASFGGLIRSLLKFKFFKELAIIDLRKVTKEKDIKKLYRQYTNEGKVIAWIIGLSKTNHPIDDILEEIGSDKETFIDEIDWSAHHKHTYIKKISKGGNLHLLSADLSKAKVKFKFDKIFSLSYEEFLMLSKLSQEDPTYSKSIIDKFYKNFPHLESDKSFSIQRSIDNVVEPVFVDISLADEGYKNNLNWNSINSDLDKHEKIYADIQDIHMGNGNTAKYSKYSLKNIMARVNDHLQLKGLDIRVDENNPTPIEFTTTKTNKQIKKQQEIKQRQFGKRFKVITATGEDRHIKNHYDLNIKKGQTVTRETASVYVEDQFELAKSEGYENVWVLSKFLIQRSYSVGKHNISLLSYDDSSESTGKQWIARGWTPDGKKQVAITIHVHFNRGQSPLYMSKILELAGKHKARHKTSIEQSIKQVLLKLTFIGIDANGDAKDWTYDEFMRSVSLRSPAVKTMAFNLSSYIMNNFNSEIIDHLLAGQKGSAPIGNRNVSVYKKSKNNTSNKNSKGKTITPSELKKLEKVIFTFIKHLDLVVPMSDAEGFDIRQVLEKISNSKEKELEFVSSFGISPMILKQVVDDKELDEIIEELTFYTLKQIEISKQRFAA